MPSSRAHNVSGGEPANDISIELTASSAQPPPAEVISTADDDEEQGRRTASTCDNNNDDAKEPPYVLSHTTLYDEELLHRATADAGRWAYGIVLVELWVMNQTRTKLFRPKGGWWVDPVYHSFVHSKAVQHTPSITSATSATSQSLPSTSTCDECQICRITCEDRADYIPATPLSPGEGLPGVLWSEIRDRNNNMINDSNVGGPGRQQRSLRGFRGLAGRGQPPTAALLREQQLRQQRQLQSENIVWRQVGPLAADPDQPWNPRLQHLAKLGFAWAAAAPFALQGETGIIIYMARQDNMQVPLLRSLENETYLISAASLIAAAYSLRQPRKVVIEARHERVAPAWNRVRSKLRHIIQRQQSVHQFVNQLEMDQLEKQKQNDKEKETTEGDQAVSSPDDDGSGGDGDGTNDVEEAIAGLADTKCDGGIRRICETLGQFVVQQWTKLQGADAQPPPSMTWRQTALTFVGVFATLTMLTHLNQFLTTQSRGEHTLILGPFGALMTLLYGLTAAPASQPRNGFLGQAIAMAIGIGFNYSSLDLWLKQSLSTSLAIAAMGKLGVTHPPAGAACLLMASPTSRRWVDYGYMLAGYCIAIPTATLVNNLSRQRQYPTYWFGIRHWYDQNTTLKRLMSADARNEKKTTKTN